MADFNIETSRALQTLEAGRTRGSAYVNQTSGLKETDMSGSTENLARNTEVRPFTVQIPEAALEELRSRIAATRWPSRELVADRSQGVQLATTQELARYWETDYDWRRCEARLNALPQFKTEIDGVDVHFIHVKSPHANALPLILTHGWPGSVIEMLRGRRPADRPARARRAPRGRLRPGACRPSPGTVFPPSQPRSAGTPAAWRRRGRS